MTFAWIDPVAFSIGPLSVHWYGIMYALGLIEGYIFFTYLSKKKYLPMTGDQIDTFLLYVFIGIVVGGRLGYVLFYNLSFYIAHPLKIFAVWDGGLSFHGALAAIVVLGLFFCRKNKINPLLLGDYAVIAAAFGMFLGRLGNFINAELYGVPTDLPIGVVFPGTDEPRHPSQLYEAGKNLLFFLVTVPIALKGKLTSKKYKPGLVLWIFILYYGVVRFFIEFVRQPDSQIGYIAFNWLTMGQIFSASMIVIAGAGLYHYFFFGSKK